jgi:DNA repair protein RecN (Recombination protein N)
MLAARLVLLDAPPADAAPADAPPADTALLDPPPADTALADATLADTAPTLVFDEVDAGIGGAAALAVGRALAALAGRHQVLVVTHLPQVAAFADHQVAVTKRDRGGATVASAHQVSGDERVVELSRMLSGQPESATARGHAEELLASASRERGR